VVSPHLPSSMFLQSILAILLLSRTANGCGSGVGGNNDYEILQDPVFSMEVSPPVGWTYFPVPTAQPALFFVGQSNDTGTAKMRADTEIVAAMTQAMVEAQLPVYNVQITNNYQPDDITNAGALTTGVAGAAYGQLAGGAITGIYEGAGMIVYIPYMKKLDVTIRNAQTTRYTWNLVKNNFLQKMALNYNAKFTGDITVNRF
ncbi:hypothetical protein PENTCL1PPCAC_4530, partial [Pristionchus entomophagus]